MDADSNPKKREKNAINRTGDECSIDFNKNTQENMKRISESFQNFFDKASACESYNKDN